MSEHSERNYEFMAAPVSTQALIITDGSITSVEGFNLSFLLNATFLSLSTNGIKAFNDDAFLGLRTLKTLLLDQNQISSFSITYSTFHELQKLQVLVLSNNVLSTIYGTWFKNMKALIRLHLNGNQLTSINADSFEMANLGNLRILDLSNNFINSIAKRAFHGLPQLMEIDLSRNRLALIPDTFSPLGQLKLLSLDQNWWNCTCKLYDLASFLRQYVNSSKILRNPENMNCTASENPSVTNLLQLTKINFVVYLSEQDICNGWFPTCYRNQLSHAYRAVPSPTPGGAGLTCLALAFFNRKLQSDTANGCPSENCCCRVLDGSQCDHEPKNYLTKRYCNCHLTWENEIKVMSRLGAGEEMPYLQKNSCQETIEPECKCAGPKTPFGSIQSKNEPTENKHFLCYKCEMLQSFPQEASQNIEVPHETELALQKYFQRTQHSENSGQSLNARLKDDTTFNQAGIRSDTRQGGHSRPVCALVPEKLGEHLANELCQSLSQTECDDCFKPYKQRHLITALSSTTEESKEHCVQAALEHQRSQCEVLARSRNISPQLDHFLISKCIYCDKNQNCPKVMEENRGKTIRLEAEESEDKGTRSAGCRMNAENIPLSPAIKKTKKLKQVSFYTPELATIKRANGTTNGLSGKRFPQNKQWHEQTQGNQSPTWAQLLSDSEAKIKERQPSSFLLMDPRREKENEPIQRYKINTKSPNSLTVQLNLHLFRKGKIQPKELHHQKSLEQPLRCQPMRLLPTSQMEEKKRKRKKNPEHSTQERSEKGKNGISNKAAVEEVPEENGKDAEIPTSASFHNMPALNIIKASSSTKHLKPPSASPTFSVNKTSRRTVPIISPSSGHSPNIAPNVTNNIPTLLHSKKLKRGTSDAEVLSFHQNSLQKESKEKHHCLSSAPFRQGDGLDFQKPSNGDYMHSQQIMENKMHSVGIDHFRDQPLKGQNRNFIRKDELEGQEKVSESESVQENLSSTESQNVMEILNTHQIISKKETDRLLPPFHLSSTLPDCQALKEELQINNREEDETLTQQLRPDFKTESNSELIPNIPLDSPGLKEEAAQSGDEWDNNKSNALHKNIVKMAIITNTFSIPSSSENGSLYLNRNMDPQKNHNVHMDNDHNLQKNLDNPFDEDSTKHKEGKTPLATHQEPPLLAEFKDVNYEQRTETSSLSCNINKAEISVPMPTPSPTSIDYKEEFPLQMEQSKANLS
ncbi:leucine-rich repeat-containing protein 53 [Pituophis catenifer annectens]|uniref:leucine-rich repeat-containing protein 53 n=1 Tax=Pituophis catenifer annectens TaxID=94852 RepID=UPI0039960154